MSRFRKNADWFLLIAMNLLAFWILARPMLSRGQMYHDNVRLFSIFRDGLHALNQYGEMMLWNPEYTTFGFPAFYFAHLGTNAFSPLSAILLFLAWLAGLLGIHIADYTSIYIVYVHLVVPSLLTISFYALARQILRHPAARLYVIIVSAFSPGVIFNYSDNGPEQAAYGFLAAAAFLKFYRRPDLGTFLLLALAAGVFTAALNHLALYWNIVFLPLFIVTTILQGNAIRSSLRRAWRAVPLWAWGALMLLLASYLWWPAASYTFGRDIFRSTIGTRVYSIQDLLAGNPIEPLSSSTPGIGFEWEQRPGVSQPDFAVTTYGKAEFGYTYLGALTLALAMLGLMFGRQPWRSRLLALLAATCLIVPLAGFSGLFTVILELVYPLRAVNHFSDTAFRNGTAFLLLLSAGFGLEALLGARSRRRASITLAVMFSVGTLLGLVALFNLYPGKLNVPFVSFFVMASILYLVVLGWLFAPGANVRHVLKALAIMVLIDVSTIAMLHCRYVIWRMAEGPFGQVPGEHLSFPETDPRRQYADGLLVLNDRAALEREGLDTARLRALPAFALYERAVSAQPSDAKGMALDDVNSLVLSDSNPPIPGDIADKTGSRPVTAPIKEVRRSYNSQTFEVQTDREMYLFWRNSMFRGWSASMRPLQADGTPTADGKLVRTPLLRAFWMFMAVRVPAGGSEVVFRFAPRKFVPLFLWTYSSLTALMLFTLLKLWRKWTSVTPQPQIYDSTT